VSAAAATDRAMLARARRRLTALSAAAVTAALLLVGVLVLAVESHAEQAAVVAQLTAACTGAADPADPPAGIWLAVQDAGGRVTASPSAPVGLPDLNSLRRADTEKVQQGTIEASGMTYLVRSERRGNRTVQAAMSVVDRDDDRRRLLGSVAIAELVGVAASLAIGAGLARRALRPLAEALRRQRQFVADASHELRTPLTQLHTRAQMLQRDVTDGRNSPAQIQEETGRLVEDSRRLGEVITDLLTSAELDHEPERYGLVEFSAVTGEVVAGLRQRADAGGVVLDLRASYAGPVRGSAAALRRVTAALVDNALGHTPRGGQVVIEVTLTPTNQVRLAVSDDGVGFDPADAERIFARFARGSQGQGRRYGLGLALVREVVTAHGGTVEASGHPGRGATFTVLLPALREF
jgi:signal transduction histidine kinase